MGFDSDYRWERGRSNRELEYALYLLGQGYNGFDFERTGAEQLRRCKEDIRAWTSRMAPFLMQPDESQVAGKLSLIKCNL